MAGNNFSFVIDSTFSPFSMQEMLVPFTAYKDAFEKSEEAYNELSDKSDKFKYLSETLPEGSKARQLYEGYAKELRTQAEDLAHNGLTMGNRRALTSLKRRYQGEIGRLSQADDALREEQKLRRSMKAQDSSMMFGNDNLSIDDFLDGGNPNLYSISGKEIYARGAAAGKAFSSRMVNVGEGNVTLGGYYRDLVAKYGYSPEVLNSFVNNMDAIPELKASFENYMESSGANANLSGANRQRAAKEYLSGVLDGAIYQENHSPQRDLGVLTKAEQIADKRAQQQQAISMWQAGAKWENGNVVGDENNINYQTKKTANDAAKQAAEIQQIQTDIMYPKGADGERHLAPEYTLGKDGKPKLSSNSSSSSSTSLDTAILKLGKKDLAHNEGFDVTAGGDRRHYNYLGAVTSHRGKWYVGSLGDHNPGHKGWGFLSSSNVENAWGILSAEGSDGDMKVMSKSEVAAAMTADPSLGNAITKRIEDAQKAGVPISDIQIIEVPNEKDSNKKGYLIAVS